VVAAREYLESGIKELAMPIGDWDTRLREINTQVEQALTETRSAEEFNNLGQLRFSLQCAIARVESLEQWKNLEKGRPKP
jgi:hypothetical protein